MIIYIPKLILLIRLQFSYALALNLLKGFLRALVRKPFNKFRASASDKNISIGILFFVCNSIFYANYYAIIPKQNKEPLLIKKEDETAMGIIAMNLLNDSYFKDLKRHILYIPHLLEQQKLRPVSSQWREIIDENPMIIHLQSYFQLLRNPNQGHSPSKNKIRVLNGAVYKEKYSLVEAVLKCSNKQWIVNEFDKLSYYKYHVYYFLENHSDARMKKNFADYGYSRDMFHCHSSENSLVDALIIESFLGNTEGIQKTIALLQKYCVDKRSGKLNYEAQNGISEAFAIFLDYNDIKNIEVLINKIKDSYLLADEFHEFLLKANDFKKLKVVEMLLSSGVDVNQVKGGLVSGTIKDFLLMRRTINDDKKYISEIDKLLDKHGAITHELLLHNRFKKVIGSIAAAIGIIACFLFYSKYLYGSAQ